jgi:hypothetical protein
MFEMGLSGSGVSACYITSMASAFENWWEQRSNCLVYHRCGFVFMIPGQRDGVGWLEILYCSCWIGHVAQWIQIQFNNRPQRGRQNEPLSMLWHKSRRWSSRDLQNTVSNSISWARCHFRSFIRIQVSFQLRFHKDFVSCGLRGEYQS